MESNTKKNMSNSPIGCFEDAILDGQLVTFPPLVQPQTQSIGMFFFFLLKARGRNTNGKTKNKMHWQPRNTLYPPPYNVTKCLTPPPFLKE
jgi:hypothetical protein